LSTDLPDLFFLNTYLQTFAQKTVPYGAGVMTILVGISALGSLSCHIMTSSRLCFVGARQGHIPDCLSLVTVDSFTPKPALVFLVQLLKQNQNLIKFHTIAITFFRFF
jgi:amino acid transporter